MNDNNIENNQSTENKNPSVKILVCYHKKDKLFKNDILVPIHCGRALMEDSLKNGKLKKEDSKWLLKNMIGDDTGDNISHLNPYFCELTGTYWAWKNYDKLGNPDYIGIMHYRRFFEVFEEKSNEVNAVYKIYNKDFGKKIKDYDLIIPKSACFGTNDSFDGFAAALPNLQTDFPYIYKQYEQFKVVPKIYFANMFIMKREEFFKYCETIFSIVINAYNTKDLFRTPRTVGYVCEYLSTFFFDYLMTEKNCKCLECKTIVYMPGLKQSVDLFLKYKVFSKFKHKVEEFYNRTNVLLNLSDALWKKIYDTNLNEKVLKFVIKSCQTSVEDDKKKFFEDLKKYIHKLSLFMCILFAIIGLYIFTLCLLNQSFVIFCILIWVCAIFFILSWKFTE